MAGRDDNGVRCIHVDTMANATFLRPCMQQYMHNITDCQARIQVANAQSMSASVQGDLGMYVINMEGHNAIPMIQPFTVHGIIPPDLSRDLMSVDELYKNGYSILFKHSTYGDGIPELFHPGDDNRASVRIPMSYDWYGNGGFRIYYIPMASHSKEQAELLVQQLSDDHE